MNKESCCFFNSFFKHLSTKAESRCTKIVDVAYRLFLERGYKNVSMCDIVKVAGGSLATLYKHFGNKEQLFIAALEAKSQELFGEWSKMSQGYEGRLEAFLMMIGHEFLRVVIENDAVLFHRLIVSVGYLDDLPFSEQVMQKVMMRPKKVISDYFDREKSEGRIDVEDTLLCAEQFLHALKDPFIFGRLVGAKIDISREKQERALHQIVTIFVKGLQRS